MGDYDHIKTYEQDAECPARFAINDRVIVQSHSSLPARPGRVAFRRWEHGNNTWGYAVHLDDGVRTMAIEAWMKEEK